MPVVVKQATRDETKRKERNFIYNLKATPNDVA
jgi:hypothetical protein